MGEGEARQAPGIEQQKASPLVRLGPPVPPPSSPTPRGESSFDEKMTAQVLREGAVRKAREQLTQASLVVRLDKPKIAAIPLPAKPDRHDPFVDEEYAVQQQELQALLDRLGKMPERLMFTPGITLIVGENGAGKSTIAKALYMRAEYEDDVEEHGDEEWAFNQVFVPNRLNAGQRLWLTQSGLAPQIAQAMDLESFQIGKSIGRWDNKYMDFPLIIGERRSAEGQSVYHADAKEDRIIGGWDDIHRSHRQTVDVFEFNKLKRYKESEPHPTIAFFDEPETGMSPRRQKQLEQEILDSTTNGSIVIVPTNSVVLFDSDLPRIDLDFPERGVHKPSQYAQTA